MLLDDVLYHENYNNYAKIDKLLFKTLVYMMKIIVSNLVTTFL